MYCKFLVLIMVFSTIGNASSDNLFGVGYNSGVSLRYKISPNTIIGLNLSGSLTDQENNANIIELQMDSTYVNYSDNDSAEYKRFEIAFEIMNNLWRLNSFELNSALGVLYSFSNEKRNDDYLSNYNEKKESRHAIGGRIGLEPTYWFFERISINTRFGLSYRYSYGESIRTTYTDDTKETVDRKSSDNLSTHNLSLYGNNLTLNLNLGIHYYF